MNLLRRLRFLLRHRQEAADLAEEVELHRAMAEEAAKAIGSVDARAQAARAMGNSTRAREDARQVWIASWMEGLWQDLRYAVRSLIAQPGFTFMAMLALVLGIGLNISLFSAINGVLLRPWPVPNADRIVRVFVQEPRFGLTGLPLQAARYFTENAHTLQGAYVEYPEAIRIDQQSKPSDIWFVSGSYFDILGVKMAIGRAFTSADDTIANPQAVGVLSHSVWATQFASDPKIIGRTALFDDVPFTIIGVAPERFRGTVIGGTDVWVPLSSISLVRANDPFAKTILTKPDWCCAEMAAKLAPDASVENARAELSVLLRQWQGPTSKRPTDVVIASASFVDPERERSVRPVVGLLLAAVGSILLIACANVSNLLLARSSARQHEIAVRAAIGAGRGRIIRQLLTEALLLSGIASVLGLVLASRLPRAILTALEAPLDVPLDPDGTVLAYSLGIAFLTAIFFGLAPALRVTKSAVNQGTRVSGRFPLRGVLLGMQVAISTVLLIGAALLQRGIQQVHSIDLGFRTERLAAIRVSLPKNRYDRPTQEAFFRDLTASASAMQGAPAGLSSIAPIDNRTLMTDFVPANGARVENTGMPVLAVNPDYFDILRIPMVAGRGFTPAEKSGDAIVVNEALARLYWPQGNAVGNVVKIGQTSPRVVGIVRDSRVYGLGVVRPTYFAPFTAGRLEPVVIVSENLASSLTALVRRREPSAMVEILPLSAQVDKAIHGSRAAATISGALGLLALLLATIGVYGIVAYSVEQRRKEIGIRMALGANARTVVGMVVARNARALVVGLVIGLGLSVLVSAAIQSQLYGLSRLDPLAYTAVLTILVLAGAAASAIPASRAARIDPVRVLHRD